MQVSYSPNQSKPEEDTAVNYWTWNSQLTPSSTSKAVMDKEKYDVLYPKKELDAICDQSAFYWNYIPRWNRTGEGMYYLATHWLLQYAHHVMIHVLLQRFTHMSMNWKTKTLRSFLEVMCWITVTGMAYQMYHNWLWAIQVGTLIGMFLSICDEMVDEILKHSLQLLVMHQPQSIDILQKLGFDVSNYKTMHTPKVSMAQSELSIFTTMLFGYTALVTMDKLWHHAQNILQFSYLILVVSIMFMVANELFSCWMPTRQLGVSVQSRWSHIGYNWTYHFTRSFVEMSVWTVFIAGVYYQTQQLWFTFQSGAVAGIGICILGGMEVSKVPQEDVNLMIYERENTMGEGMYRIAKWISHLY